MLLLKTTDLELRLFRNDGAKCLQTLQITFNIILPLSTFIRLQIAHKLTCLKTSLKQLKEKQEKITLWAYSLRNVFFIEYKKGGPFLV